MHKLKESILFRQNALRRHGLFALLDESSSAEALARLARGCAWLPMVFQDILRLNLERVRGTEFERFAKQHQNEDAGHEQWFLEDLGVFGVGMPRIDDLFGDDYRPIRDACYALTAEALRVQTGGQRLALVLGLEAAGHVFFEHMSSAVERLCPELPLRYFGRYHLGVEKGHDLFLEATDADLERIVLADDERAEAEACILRVSRTFEDIFKYYAQRMEESLPRASHIHELGHDEVGHEARRAHGS
jgi:hypothetical protein